MAGKDKPGSQAEVVRELLGKIAKQLGDEKFKVTLADYIRLVQLKRELEGEEPRDVRVIWDEGRSSED